jgi:membrane protease YdiL (CAAX protease family)
MRPLALTKQSFQKLHPVHYPISFSIAAVFLIAMLGRLLGALVGLPQYQLLLAGVITLVVAFAFQRPQAMLLTTRFRWPSLKYYSLPLLLLVGIHLLTGGYDFSQVDKVVFWNMMGIGVFEEVLIHGIFMALILEKWGSSKKNLKKAALLGAFIFGLLHLNAILADPTDPHLIQWKIATVIFATFLSIGFAGLAWQSQSIWGAALIHGLIDVAANVGDPAMLDYIYNNWDWRCTIVSVLYCSPMAILGIWLLNKDVE